VLAGLVVSVYAQSTAETAEIAARTAAAKAAAAKTPDLSKDGAVVLTPFQVNSTKDSGYFAENTLAGSRLNTNLADLAASITVVTKQQMDDTAALDINDVFKYEASTEGPSSYTPSITDRGTAKDSIAGYSFGNNGDSSTNAQANRVRGMAAPDAAINNFPTNNRIPFDSYNTQSVEITRGPNSLLFGLGTPAGIVNQTSAQAALNRNTNQVVMRTDQYGSFRTSLTMNRSLLKDKLAVYGAFLYNNQQFQRKPSRDLTRRQYGALTYKPFSKTVIRGFAENYQNNANRPNSLTPRDFVTPWFAAGRPVTIRPPA
jgi:outer membrane receptor protein involved in Fe transport